MLITTSTFPVTPDDGTPRFIYDLAQALTVHADVTVLAPDSAGAARKVRDGNLEILRFPYWLPRARQRLALGHGMRDNLRGSWTVRLQVPTFLVCQGLATRRLIEARHMDVVNAHWMIPQGLTSAWAARGRARLVLHAHAGDVYLLRRLPLGRAMARYLAARADAIMADGSHVRDTLNQLLGYPSDAVLRPMGVHVACFGRPDYPAGQPTAPLPGIAEFPEGFLLFFGRMAEKKGAVYLVRALPTVLGRCPGLGLVLVGDGPERPELEQEVGRLGLDHAVRFAGRRPHTDIVRYLHRCRVAVVPSIIDSRGETEGMPTVVVEALAAGVRVVGSAVDGIPDVLRHQENGWLCRPRDPADLADKILDALADPPASEVVRRARVTADQHDWRKVALDYMGWLERAIAAPSRFQAQRVKDRSQEGEASR